MGINHPGVVVTFNQTNVELKHGRGLDDFPGQGLLIRPMWNWNREKFPSEMHVVAFNQTNVELKQDRQFKPTASLFLLIRPMWNWNLLSTPIADAPDDF